MPEKALSGVAELKTLPANAPAGFPFWGTGVTRVCKEAAALLLLGLLAGTTVFASETYYRKDLQYFKPPLADVRGPHTYTRLYSHRPVAFTSNPKRDHRFWDVGFGGHFAWWGYRPKDSTPRNRMETKGVEVFWESSAHALLDFGAHSNALINADYRIGLGVAGRSLPWNWKGPRFSWRLKVFHESSHLGDEFVLDALKRDGLLAAGVVGEGGSGGEVQTFQRYNVGYEALELSASVDGYTRDYWRWYWVGRLLNHGAYEAEPLNYREEALNAPMRANKWEVQTGAEFFGRLDAPYARWRSPNWWIGSLNAVVRRLGILNYLLPSLEEAQYWLVAEEVYLRSEYTTHSPKQALANNLLAGLAWGDYFAADEGVSAFALLLNHYRGPNPHGQFRSEALRYWGLEFRVRI